MEYFEMKNGSRASRLALGTWAFSGAKIWGDNREEDSIRTVHMAMERGINLFDTANRYGDGKAEEVLGKALRGRRDRALVATKIYSDELRYDVVIRTCEDTLRRLQTDYVDLYQIHWPNHEIPLEETFRAFEKLRRDGKVRMFGVCNFGMRDITEAAQFGVAMNQLPYALVWRVIEREVIPACERAGVPVWAYIPLGQGLLSGKYRTIDDVPLNRRETRFYSSKWKQGRHNDPGFETEVFAFLDRLRALTEESGYSMPELAFAFLKSRAAVASILMGARNETQLEQNLAAYERQVPAEIVERAVALSEPLFEAEGTDPDLWEGGGGRMR